MPGLQCEVFGGIATPPEVCITWRPVPPDLNPLATHVLLDGETIATLAPDAFQYKTEPFTNLMDFSVVVELEGGEMREVDRCLLTYEPPVIGGLQRGDCNGDGEQELADGVCILTFLFIDGVEPGCLQTADVDDNAEILITDAILLLNHLFLGGPPPAQPFPDCGHDTSPDDLGCNVHGPCFTPPPP